MVGWCSMGTFNDPCIWVGVKIQEPGDCRFWCNVSVLAIHFCVPQFWLIPWVEIIYIYHLVIKHSHGRSTCLIGTPSISICAIFHGKLLVITRGCIYIIPISHGFSETTSHGKFALHMAILSQSPDTPPMFVTISQTWQWENPQFLDEFPSELNLWGFP